MHLRRIAVVVVALVAAVIIVVIAGMIFMGLFGREGPTKDDPRPIPKPSFRRPSSATKGAADRRPSTTTTTPGTWTASGTHSLSMIAATPFRISIPRSGGGILLCGWTPPGTSSGTTCLLPPVSDTGWSMSPSIPRLEITRRNTPGRCSTAG